MAFTAKDVQALRERTGVGMMDCKKALVESDGDMEKAIDFLREKGLAAATKKASRIAAEGAVMEYSDENSKVSVLVEINSETDFVAKNEEFKAFGVAVAKTVSENAPVDVDALLALTLSGTNRTVLENLQDKILSIGENIKIRRFERIEGAVSSYIHGGGTVGVMVLFDTDKADNEQFKVMGKDIAMQIAAMMPQYVAIKDIPDDVVAREKEIFLAQIKDDPAMSSKPEKVIEGIVKGKIAKLFKEICLLEQAFVKDDKISVSKYIENTAKEIGGKIELLSFTRFAKGEGLQKREDNFADEVAGMVK
ncbi:MAG: elongation factor Ts [Clostridiales bacterium]|jgi:elongation factor Ts|nr:elongation factor Ts [Clostridiales bacterium]